MTVFNQQTITALENVSCNVLFNRLLQINPPYITHEEMLTLFVDEGDRDVLRRAPIVGNDNYPSSSFHYSWDGRLSLRFHLHGRNRPLAPRHPKLQPDAPQELVDRFTNKVDSRVKAGIDVGRVTALVKYLGEACSSIHQVRYVFPPIVALLRLEPELNMLADKIAALRTPRRIISLDPELRQSIKLASATVSTAMILDDHSPVTEPEVNFDVIMPSIQEGLLVINPL